MSKRNPRAKQFQRRQEQITRQRKAVKEAIEGLKIELAITAEAREKAIWEERERLEVEEAQEVLICPSRTGNVRVSLSLNCAVGGERNEHDGIGRC